jgi:CelD/BcsL family acetyltransferase involved in cellulose biosynthesis
LYADGEAVAIAPLYISNARFKSITVRKLSLIENAYSPLCNIIYGCADPARLAEYFRNFMDYLTTKSALWDIFIFGPFSDETIGLYDAEGDARRRGLPTVRESCHENWYLDGIACSGEEYLAGRSKNFRKSLGKRIRHLEEEGPVEVQIVSRHENLDGLMDDYYCVYGKSWKLKEQIGPNFHRNLAKLSESKGWLRLGFVRVNGVPKATSYAIVSGAAGYLLKSAYDQEMRSYGLGTMLRIEMIRTLIDQDHVTRIDLGSGNEGYKQTFATEKRHLQSVIFFSKGIKGCLLTVLCVRVLPVIRRCRLLNRCKNYLSERLRP